MIAKYGFNRTIFDIQTAAIERTPENNTTWFTQMNKLCENITPVQTVDCVKYYKQRANASDMSWILFDSNQMSDDEVRNVMAMMKYNVDYPLKVAKFMARTNETCASSLEWLRRASWDYEVNFQKA